MVGEERRSSVDVQVDMRSLILELRHSSGALTLTCAAASRRCPSVFADVWRLSNTARERNAGRCGEECK